MRQTKLTKRTTSRLLILAALLCAGEPAAGDPAADEAKARALFNKAENHYNQGDYSNALKLYKEAYTLAPLPGFLFNIGQCHRYLDQHEEALFFYKAYLDRFPEAPNKDDVKKLIKISKKVVDEKRARGEIRSVTQDIPKQDPPKPAVVKPVLPKPVVVKPVLPPQDRMEADRDEHAESLGTSRRGIWLWSGLGLSSALLIASGVTGYQAHDRSEEYNDPSTPQDKLRDLKDSGEAYGTASIVTAATGGALAIVTILYYLLGPSSAEIQSAAFVPKSQTAAFMATW